MKISSFQEKEKEIEIESKLNLILKQTYSDINKELNVKIGHCGFDMKLELEFFNMLKQSIIDQSK